LDDRHEYILAIVAEHLALEPTHVEDAMLEGSQVTTAVVIVITPHDDSNVLFPVVSVYDSASLDCMVGE